eukprot:SAG31_NODE_2543_length_5534_cov_9.026311_4_plen_292_part_00
MQLYIDAESVQAAPRTQTEEGLQRIKEVHQLQPQLSSAALVADAKRRLQQKSRSTIVRAETTEGSPASRLDDQQSGQDRVRQQSLRSNSTDSSGSGLDAVAQTRMRLDLVTEATERLHQRRRTAERSGADSGGHEVREGPTEILPKNNHLTAQRSAPDPKMDRVRSWIDETQSTHGSGLSSRRTSRCSSGPSAHNSDPSEQGSRPNSQRGHQEQCPNEVVSHHGSHSTSQSGRRKAETEHNALGNEEDSSVALFAEGDTVDAYYTEDHDWYAAQISLPDLGVARLLRIVFE